MAESPGQVASATFADRHGLLRAVHALRAEGFTELTVYSPLAEHDVWEALEPGTSPVRFWTLAGGLLGCASGFALTIGTSLDWPLRTSAKPIVSLPPFFIIAFELTILLGALGALAGFLFHARLPRSPRPLYDERFSEDRFGVAVTCDGRSEAAQEILQREGAEEVRFAEN